ncbi:MAG: hypothetical protein WCF23_21405 [Candidatus Nitrosopolaris sp.]
MREKLQSSPAETAVNNDNQLLFEPTAVLAKAPPNQPRKRSSIYNISSLDFTT